MGLRKKVGLEAVEPPKAAFSASRCSAALAELCVVHGAAARTGPRTVLLDGRGKLLLTGSLLILLLKPLRLIESAALIEALLGIALVKALLLTGGLLILLLKPLRLIESAALIEALLGIALVKALLLTGGLLILLLEALLRVALIHVHRLAVILLEALLGIALIHVYRLREAHCALLKAGLIKTGLLKAGLIAEALLYAAGAGHKSGPDGLALSLQF